MFAARRARPARRAGRVTRAGLAAVMMAGVMMATAPRRAWAQPAPPPPPAQPVPPAPSSPSPSVPFAGSSSSPSPPSSVAPAGSSPSPAVRLREANGAAQLGDWAEVERLAAPLAAPAARPQLSPADAAELHRLLGLAYFFTDRAALAEAELWAYLQLDLDAHLDPATVPPEAITFFESIQAKHRAELRALREARMPKPPPRRSALLSVVPVASQLQNGERTKAWVYGVSLGTLAATNLTSYLLLRRWCREGDGTCDRTGVDRTGVAKSASVVNVVSGVGLLAVTALAIIDGVRGYRRAPMRATPSVSSSSVGVSFALSLEGSF